MTAGTLYTKKNTGQLLVIDGVLATSDDCCCAEVGDDCVVCTDDTPVLYKATFSDIVSCGSGGGCTATAAALALLHGSTHALEQSSACGWQKLILWGSWRLVIIYTLAEVPSRGTLSVGYNPMPPTGLICYLFQSTITPSPFLCWDADYEFANDYGIGDCGATAAYDGTATIKGPGAW